MQNLKNFRLDIEYDGTKYHGWQRQLNDITIQSVIEDAVFKILNEKVSLIGSGRTDAGVHALNQVANFLCKTHLSSDIILNALNSLLPVDIAILSCEEVDINFHSRYNAKTKIYNYYILNQKIKSALNYRYCWQIKRPLDINTMEDILPLIIGTYDFKSFEASGSPKHHTIRTIFNADFKIQENNYIIFEIEANGFLRYMVRNLVGTIVDVGLKKISVNDFKIILDSKDRNKAGITAPPQGLFLKKVNY